MNLSKVARRPLASSRAGSTSQTRRPIRRRRLPPWLLRLVVFVVFAALWQTFAALSGSFLIPSFTETVQAAWQLTVVKGTVWGPLLDSNGALVIGYAISAALALPLGLAAGRVRLLDRALDPYSTIILAIPVAPLIPVVITALGISLAARVSIVVLFSGIFIYVNTRAGVRGVDRQLIEMAHSFGASERLIWRRVVIPSAMPATFAGLRIGLGRALTGMVVVELLLVATGIGNLLLDFSARLESDKIFATVGIVIAEALLLLQILTLIERKVAPWHA